MFVYQWFSIVSGLFVVRALIIDQSDQKNRDFSHLEMVEDEKISLEVIQQVLENVTSFFDRNNNDVTAVAAPATTGQESNLGLSSILNDLLNNNGAGDHDDDDESTFRSENIEKAKWAKCEPELKSIKLPYDPQFVQWPSCIRLKQCGGCCMHSKLECRPTSVRTRLFEVQQLRYAGNGKWSRPIKELAKLDEHLACQCSCKITAADCGTGQVYNRTKCQCECRPDSDDRTKCLKRENADRFVWDEQKCECRCRRSAHECNHSSSTYFDPNRCQCVRTLTNPKRLAKPNDYSNLTNANRHKYFYNSGNGTSESR